MRDRRRVGNISCGLLEDGSFGDKGDCGILVYRDCQSLLCFGVCIGERSGAELG